MSETNDNKQPRRRRTQLNAAQYTDWQQTDYPYGGKAADAAE